MRIYGCSPVLSTKAEKLKLSLIVCIRNEEGQIKGLLDSLLPSLPDEIILVLDRCTDQTETIINSYSGLPVKKVTILETGWPESPKKWAVLQGILASSGDVLAFTDADCRVFPNFPDRMKAGFERQDILIGYSLPMWQPDSLLKSIQYADSVFTALKYTFFTQNGFPYMAVGRNWGFRKSLFSEADLSSHSKLLSGDDDLLFQALQRKTSRVGLLFQNNPTSGLKPDWRSFFRQKSRHYKAGTRYPTKVLLRLALVEGLVPFLTLVTFLSLAFGYWMAGVVSGTVLVGFSLILAIKARRILRKLDKNVPPVTRLAVLGALHFLIAPVFSVFSQFLNPEWK